MNAKFNYVYRFYTNVYSQLSLRAYQARGLLNKVWDMNIRGGSVNLEDMADK